MASRLVLVNYAGDFREAHERLSAGGAENYYAQRYSVDTVMGLTDLYSEVVVVVCKTDAAYDSVLPAGVRAIGLGQTGAVDPRSVVSVLDRLRPTHLVLMPLLPRIVLWAMARRVPFALLTASSYSAPDSLKRRLKAKAIALLLNSPRVRWVGAYGLSGARSFRDIGVRASKIVPWDFLHVTEDDGFPPLDLAGRRPRRLVYVGRMIPDKGVPDLVRAVRLLRDEGTDVELALVGNDEGGQMARLAEAEGVADRVEFAGAVATDRLEAFMRDFDVIVIPSRHSFAEGFPLVITHALRARLPIVASDHPMFREVLRHGESAVIFPAGDAAGLARAIRTLVEDPALHSRLSRGSAAILDRVRLPTQYHHFLRSCFDDAGPGKGGLAAHTLDRFPD